MTELVKITNEDGKQVVNARELHEVLEVKTQFNDWIIRRIGDYDFIEDENYELLFFDALKNEYVKKQGVKSMTKQQMARQQISKEYAISLDMAKELSMVEKTVKGKEVRRYFIAAEKSLREAAKVNHAQPIGGSQPLFLEINQLYNDFQCNVRSVVIDFKVYYMHKDLLKIFYYPGGSSRIHKLPCVVYGNPKKPDYYVSALEFQGFAEGTTRFDVKVIGKMLDNDCQATTPDKCNSAITPDKRNLDNSNLKVVKKQHDMAYYNEQIKHLLNIVTDHGVFITELNKRVIHSSTKPEYIA